VIQLNLVKKPVFIQPRRFFEVSVTI